jgi:ferredoxin-NADP reductase
MADTEWFPVTVVAARWEADQVVSLTLAGHHALPDWEAGAHVDVRLSSGLVRQYSLCGDPADPTYTIAVLREPAGRGGSAEVHDTALLGRTLQIRGPRNHFRLEPADRYVFIAGGIGVTPILPMVREAVRRGASWQLHYGGRRAGTMAFTHTLQTLGTHGAVAIRSDDRDGPLPLTEIVQNAPPHSLLYACGPAGMLAALRSTVAAQRPELPLNTEQFTADPSTSGAAQADSFEVELAHTGETVVVRPGTSILEAVRTLRPDVLSSCEEGFCGTCETKVLAGQPIHQDSILSEHERARNTTMMICVGGCASPRLVLDL